MRKLLLILCAAVGILAVSCDPNSSTNDNVDALTLTSPATIRADKKGGTEYISYNINGQVSGKLSVKVINEELITAVDTTTPGIIALTISENPTQESREGAVSVSYASSAFSVKVLQEGNPDAPTEVISIRANQLVGNYYGEKLNPGVGHYWIILTKDGFVNGSTVPGGEYFRLDLIATLAKSNENITLPDGDYRFDSSNSFEPFTIVNIGNTDYTWIDNTNEAWAYNLVDASLSVRGNHIELVAVVDGKEYRVTFDGSYSLTPPYEITDYVSSLTQDTVIDVSNCNVSCTNYGDYWDCGNSNWGIEFVCKDGMKYGTYVVLDLISASSSDVSGTYVASGFCTDDPTKPDFRPGVFVPGFRVSSESDLLLGSLFLVYRDGLCVSQASLYDGTVTITDNGNGTHTIVIDCYDDAPKPNKITLNWTGTL